MARQSGQGGIPSPIKASRRVANVLSSLVESGMVPGYAPEGVGAVAHKADEPEVIWVEIERILDSPYQHQEQLDQENFGALVESIKTEGFLAALNVNAHPERAGYYFLTAGGHQRRDAAKAVGKTKIPVFVEPRLDPIRLAFRAAKENVIQVNRSPVNQGHLFLQMQAEFNLTQNEIAAELSKDRSYIKFCIMAARATQDIQELLTLKPNSQRAVTYLSRLERAENRTPIIAQFLAGDLSTEGVQAAVEAVLERQAQVIQPSPDVPYSPTEPTNMGTMASEEDRPPPASGGNQPSRASQSAGVVQFVAGPQRLDLPTKPPRLAQRDLATPSVEPPHEVGSEPATIDYQILEREGKLKSIIGRMENYRSTRGTAPLSAREREYLSQMVAMGQELLGE